MQIPARLMKDSAVLLIPSEKGVFDDPYEEVGLEGVRICYSGKVKLSNNNTAASAGGTLYFDCAVSKPSETQFSTLMKLKIGGRQYRISAVEQLKGESRPHHFKITFV